MKRTKNTTLVLTSLCVLLLAMSGCQQKVDSVPPVNAGNTAQATPAKPADTKPAAASETEIAGDYTISGTNESGGGAYTGDLKITKRDAVYQFSWQSGGNTYDGVGVRTGNDVAVAFTEGTDGKGCGVVLYSIGANGDLDGKAGYWGVNNAEMETAKRESGTGLEGKYKVSGKNTAGEAYTADLSVKKDGEGYGFEWTGGTTLTGFGIQRGNTAAVGFGGQQCGFVLYQAKPDGTLDGKWGGQGSKSFGTETAKRK